MGVEICKRKISPFHCIEGLERKWHQRRPVKWRNPDLILVLEKEEYSSWVARALVPFKRKLPSPPLLRYGVIPAVSAVMGTKKLPYPVRVFDIVHCARCRVPCHIEGGKLLLELNRVLRPGGYFVCSATLVYQKIPEDVEIWKAMAELTKVMCWELVNKTSKDAVNNVAVATFRKPTSNECYEQRSQQEPPLCPESDDPNAS